MVYTKLVFLPFSRFLYPEQFPSYHLLVEYTNNSRSTCANYPPIPPLWKLIKSISNTLDTSSSEVVESGRIQGKCGFLKYCIYVPS